MNEKHKALWAAAVLTGGALLGTTELLTEKFAEVRKLTAENHHLRNQIVQVVSDGKSKLTAVRNDALQVKAALKSDKDAALQETFEALPRMSIDSDRDHISRQFKQLSYLGWMKNARRSVGFFSATTLVASGVMLDKQGTIAFTAHQVPPPKSKIDMTFYPAAGKQKTVPVRIAAFDGYTDTAFGTVTPSDARALLRAGVKPAEWSVTQAAIPESKPPLLMFIGFPQGSRWLHAVSGDNGDYVARSDAGSNCKVTSTALAFEGMSGGGVFSHGHLMGLINSSHDPGTSTFSAYTPLVAVEIGYAKAFPARAAKKGLTPKVMAQIESSAPKECLPPSPVRSAPLQFALK